MEATNNKKEMIILQIYSVLILIYAAFDILTVILPKFQIFTIKLNVDLINYFFTFTGIAFYTTPINIIVGYGLLRRRFWARYGVIAAMLTFPVPILSKYLSWGINSFHIDRILISLFFIILTLFYFTKKNVKDLFGEARPFKLKSWCGLLVILIILLSFHWIIMPISPKIWTAWKLGLPFFQDKPKILTLEKPRNFDSSGKYQKAELIGISLLVPKGFSLTGLKKDEERASKWTASFRDIGPVKRGYIGIAINHYAFEFEELEDIRKNMGPCTKFDYEKFILTNNWNPVVWTMRLITMPSEGGSIREIHINGLKGFLKRWQRKDNFSIEFSIYDKDDKRSMLGSVIVKKAYFDEEDLLTILSSIEFLEPEELHRAKYHYEKGLELYLNGDILQAQIEFANAYYLSPENPDYIFMVAKSLLTNETKNYKHIKELLDLVLKIKPDHKVAQKLLKEIESKLPKANSSH